MKNILITGLSGFIGRHLSEELGGYFNIKSLDRSKGFDVSNPNAFDLVHGHFDAAIHLAGLSFVPDSFKNPFEFYRVNVNGALNVAELCRKLSVPILIYPNTYVYGAPATLPVAECHPISLPSPYHKSKMLAEDLLCGYFATGETRVIALRVFNLYGRYQNEKFLVPQILREARETGKITVRDLVPKRDFLYIKDFVRLVRLILQSETVRTSAYNIGYGESHSVAQLIQVLGALLGRDLEVTNLNQRRPNEIMDCYADIGKIYRELGWKPSHSLRDGLAELLGYAN